MSAEMRRALTGSRRIAARDVAGRPSITAVIPCYRYGVYLPRAVQAALDQNGVDVRVVIVDDASPDDSGAVAEALAAADDRITVLRHSANRGHIATYNDGLALVDTEFVTLVSADDVVAAGSFARAIALMQQHPSVGLVYGAVETFEKDVPSGGGSGRVWWRLHDGATWGRRLARRTECEIRSPEAVLRTDAMRSVGEYNPALPRTADMEYWVRTSLRWDVGYVGGPPQAYYRIHGENMHTTQYNDLASMVLHRYRALLPLLSLPGEERLHGVARRKLAGIGLRHVHRRLATGIWEGWFADVEEAIDEIWPAWRLSRRWRGLARSLDDGLRPGMWTRLSGLAPAHIDRIRFGVRRVILEGVRR